MSRQFFKAIIQERAVETTRRQLEVYRIELQMQLLGAGAKYAPPIPCQWDSGAELSVLSEDVARDLDFPLSDDTEETGIRGVMGDTQEAWLIPRFVRFPGLDGVRFQIYFLIPKGSVGMLPLLGMRDTYRNFEVISRDGEVFFFLKRNHAGQTI